MGYSVKESATLKESPSCEVNVFKKKEWERYHFAKESDVKWFKEARYGLFLHVGISAVGMVDISWPRKSHKLPDMPFWGKTVADEEYDSWAKKIAFSKFDAKEWARIAKEGGFRYVVIIAKHHDGFHMWDTAFSDYKITNAPFGRDYLKEVIDAFRAEGIKIGIYYSKRDWIHPDYEPVSIADAHAISKPPYFEMNEGKSFFITEKHKKYQKYMFDTVRELMTNYGKIDLLWWDAEWNSGMFTKEMWNSEELEKMVKVLQPHIVINNRAGLPGDFDSPEGKIGFFQNHRLWETCMPLGDAWAHTDGKIKSAKTLVSQILNCVGGDGNYLLSVGCTKDGEIAPEEATRLKEVGTWLNGCGESVYATRGGIWKPTKKYVACYRGSNVYLHILKSAPIVQIKLPLVKNNFVGAKSLGEEKVKVKKKNGKLYIRISKRKKGVFETIIKIKLSGTPIMENDKIK